MAGKSKGPKLHTRAADVPAEPPAEQPTAAEFASLLSGLDELPEEMYRWEMLSDGKLPIEMFWTEGAAPEKPYVYIGSPHGGPVFRLTVERLPDCCGAQARQGLRDQYDARTAKWYHMTLAEFRACLARGEQFADYTPYDDVAGVAS
jgi:hypothetical protein